MNDFQICPFEAKYINEILVIDSLSFSMPWSKKSITEELNNKFAKYIVMKQNNKVIGYAGAWIILDEAHITNIAIHPKYRGAGAGSFILESLIEICSKDDINTLTLEVRKSNTIAQNLYNKFGFKEEGIRKNYYANNNEDAIIMWKR